MTEAIARARNDAVLTEIMDQLAAVEARLAEYKILEQEQKDLKDELFERMEEFGVKKWEMPNGTKITAVEAIPPSEATVTKFDEAAFKMDEPDTYELYCRKTVKKDKGRKGYVRITLPKEQNDG